MLDNQSLKYALKLNGQIITPLCETEVQALAYGDAFPTTIRAQMEVVRVTADGQSLLLG